MLGRHADEPERTAMPDRQGNRPVHSEHMSENIGLAQENFNFFLWGNGDVQDWRINWVGAIIGYF
jgi:hypothetical protein